MGTTNPTPARRDAPSPLVSAATASRHYSVSQALLYRLAKRNLIPHYRVGRTVRFRLDELAEAIEHGPP